MGVATSNPNTTLCSFLAHILLEYQNCGNKSRLSGQDLGATPHPHARLAGPMGREDVERTA